MYIIKCPSCGRWFKQQVPDEFEYHIFSKDRVKLHCPHRYCKHEIWRDENDDDSEEYLFFLLNNIQENIDAKEWEKGLDNCNELLTIDKSSGYFQQARIYCYWTDELDPRGKKEDIEKSNDLWNKVLQNCEYALYFLSESKFSSQDDAMKGQILSGKGWALTELHRYSEARDIFIGLMKYPDVELSEEAKKDYSLVTDNLMHDFNLFTEVEKNNDYSEDEKKGLFEYAESLKFCNCQNFSDRQFIFIVRDESAIAGCFDKKKNIRWIFTQDKLPKDIYFPLGHPVPNTLYVAHMAQKGLYLPFEGAEDKMFDDKIEQFCQLSQCLGAEEISFRSLRGKSITESEFSSLNQNGNLTIMKAKGGFNSSDNQGLKSEKTSSQEVMFTIKFDSDRKPYCPNNLEWLSCDSSWQNFVKQRLEGNIITYSKKISSSETIGLTSNKKNSLQGSFQYLMAKVEAGYEESLDKTFSSSDNSEWEINVRFKSLKDYSQELHQTSKREDTLSPNEEIYKKEVLFYLEDGEIGDFERKALDRKKKKLGIDDKRATYIEATCMPKLSQEEIEYLGILRELLGDNNEISPRIRKILDREAEHLGLTPKRIQELENM